ncbi:pantetheine-phosphate adenylyltransferase [Bacteroidota bacterium]
MNKIAVFPGSFDPFTIGHESIVKRSLPLFDKIYIAIGVNITKKGYFPLEKRMDWINMVFEEEPKIEVVSFTGLTVNLCKKVNANYIIRGLRTSSDFEYERTIGQLNRSLDANVETIFTLTRPEHTFINSTMVRDIILNGEDASQFLPDKLKNIKFL